MEIVKRYDNLYIMKDDSKIFESNLNSNGLTFYLIRNNPVLIEEKDDYYLYNNLKKILGNNYTFDDSGLSKKIENTITFVSDDFRFNKKNLNTLTLEDLGDKIRLNGNSNNNENVKIDFLINDGAYSINNKTHESFQSDMIDAVEKTMRDTLIKKKSKTL